ncbi:MAG: Holliday junction resolvase RuvX [Candidatus Nomurabacteria bacterium]|jgi:putative Holliday junction resolvase|nr:Holliday junction resolvase RuvX [Candidatus Nomurabacteria bacterium]
MSKIVIGLDVGERRIGVARGDFGVKIASPLQPLVNDEQIFSNIAEIASKNRAETIVIGLPRNASGQETAQSEYSRDFASKLADFTEVKIVFQDESLTSIEAEKNLRRRKNFNENMLRDGTLDSEAATLILQDFLERIENA